MLVWDWQAGIWPVDLGIRAARDGWRCRVPDFLGSLATRVDHALREGYSGGCGQCSGRRLAEFRRSVWFVSGRNLFPSAAEAASFQRALTEIVSPAEAGSICFILPYPALTRWANECRRYAAG